MDILSISSQVQARAVVSPPQEDKSVKGDTKAKTSPVSQESFEASADYQSVRKVWDKINSLPEVRIEKVEEIKKEIKKNNYPLENRLYKAIERMTQGKILHAVIA